MRLSSLRNDENATERALQFPNYLLHRGEGRLETAEDGMVELPESVQRALDIDTLCSTVFDGLESNYSDVSWLTSRAILRIISTGTPNSTQERVYGHASSQFVTSERACEWCDVHFGAHAEQYSALEGCRRIIAHGRLTLPRVPCG